MERCASACVQKMNGSMSPRFARRLVAADARSLPVRAFWGRWPKSNKKSWRKLMKPLSAPRSPDGLLLVDKAERMTSHDVVAPARRRLGAKDIGPRDTLARIPPG